MFYSQFILAKKGPLGTIWIAAHLERKLRKNQVADTDIGVSVDSILCPDVPIALRLSSHLLLGVVRIYSRKVNYLFDDCSDALLKVKQAFRSAAVDLPPEQSKAPYHSITLPETFDLDDFELPDNEIFQGNFVDHHVSAREHITLQDSMDGVAFTTSQFGPDERFGDGDASQIGLDLDEELFLEKGEAAGTREMLIDTDVDPKSSVKASSPPKDDQNNEGISDPPAASPVSYFSIQAPSTPGLMEEPNFPNAEEAFVSDDHMDEDHNAPELAAKDMSGTASSELEPPNFGSVEINAYENTLYLNEQETGKVRSPRVDCSTEELISPENAQLNSSNDHVEVANGQENVENTLNGNCVEIERNPAANSEVDEVGINGNATPLTEATSVMDVHSSDQCAGSDKTDLNGAHLLLSDKSEKGKSSVSFVVPGTGQADVDPHNADQSCIDVNIPKASKYDTGERLSYIPVLQACNSGIHRACNGVSSSVIASGLPVEGDGPHPLEIIEKEDVHIVSGVSIEVEDMLVSDNINIAEVDQMIVQENVSEKAPDSRVSDFSAPEKLLSMPSLPVGEFKDFLNECTPGKEHLAEGGGDATAETIISGRKRSYTESTLIIQSLNSAESSGATPPKSSGELIPNDNDLLSSILGGKISTSLKIKHTPPVTHSVPSKRQRTAVRSSAHKRKVLVDDATVLHGDTIRQQLTDTEDIRRVRKKAPCTRLEIWVLHKQILEDDIFCETVFTGMSSDLVSLHSETLDMSRTIVIQDEQSKETMEIDNATRPLLDEETLPSVTGGDKDHAESLVENPGQQGSTIAVDRDIVHEETSMVENEVAKDVSENHASYDKDGKEIGDGEALELEQASSLGHISEVHFNTLDNTIIDSLSQNQTTVEGASSLEASCGEEMRDQEGVNLPISEKLEDQKSDEKYSAEGVEVETTVIEVDTQDRCLSPVRDISDAQSLHPEDVSCPTSDQFMEGNQSNEVGTSKMEETLSPIHYIGKESKLDSSCTIEADMSSHNTILNEGENQGYCKTDPQNFTESTPICTDYVDVQGQDVSSIQEFGTDVFEHDTGFLNVDDDDVAEDYEGDDAPSAEEKHILDNSGWSSRTRAVANYLQVIFEKEAQHGNKETSLEYLLTGKSRKEASRMFFETLVLKTKDYIHAEQAMSFSEIRIKPRGKLLKSEF